MSFWQRLQPFGLWCINVKDYDIMEMDCIEGSMKMKKQGTQNISISRYVLEISPIFSRR